MPRPGAPIEKLNRKFHNLEQRRRGRERRLAAMSPEERERHEAWHRARKPGKPADRERRRRDLEARREFEEALARPRIESPETRRLAEDIAVLERLAAKMAAAAGAARTPPEGVVGGLAPSDWLDPPPGPAPGPLDCMAQPSATAADTDLKAKGRNMKRHDTPERALARNLDRIRTEGLDAATDAVIRMLCDPKTPAQAQSVAVNAVYRASGLYGKPESKDDLGPAEMSSAELAAQIRGLEALARIKSAEQADDGGDEHTGGDDDSDREGDIFG
jgi:hypothetical protein